jgi:hypothetical protein
MYDPPATILQSHCIAGLPPSPPDYGESQPAWLTPSRLLLILPSGRLLAFARLHLAAFEIFPQLARQTLLALLRGRFTRHTALYMSGAASVQSGALDRTAVIGYSQPR